MPNLVSREYSLTVERTGLVLANHVKIADSFISRMVGLLSREALGSDEALIIPRCTCVHTFGMKFPIDVVFADKNFSIRSFNKSLKPSRVSGVSWGARFAIELNSGAIERLELRLGDRLLLGIQKVT